LKVYCDTSFLLSFYLTDSNSERAIKVVEQLKNPIPYTMFHRFELRNAFRLAIFRGMITPQRCKEAFQDLETDLKDATLVHRAIDWVELFRTGEVLSAAHTEKRGARALDLMHLSLALVLKSTHLYTFDVKQREIARSAGLKVSP
jgi:predicted nucleic acid-binding protein